MKYLEATLIFLSVALVALFTWIFWMALEHQCPRPSVEHVQSEINKAKADWETPIEVDGIAGIETVTHWMFYSTGWEAENERSMK